MDLNEAAADIATLSAFGKASQLHRLLRLDFPFDDGPDKGTLLVNTMHAREELSRDFCIDLELLSDNAFIPLNAMMAKMATVSLVRVDGSLRYFNGCLARLPARAPRWRTPFDTGRTIPSLFSTNSARWPAACWPSHAAIVSTPFPATTMRTPPRVSCSSKR